MIHGRRFRVVSVAAACLALAGCADLPIGLESPGVTVTSFRTVPTDTMAPRFEVGLNITNPNGVPLNVEGIAYSISLEGRPLLEGVTNQIDPIEAYGSGDIAITAVPDLINSVRVIADLLRNEGDTVNYTLEAKLDLGGLWPALRVRDEGEISLRGQ